MKKGERCPLNTSKALPRPGAKPRGLFSAINKHKVSYLFVAPYLLLFVLFTVLPVLIAVVLSFTSFNVLEPPEFVGFSNYSTLFFQDTVFIGGTVHPQLPPYVIPLNDKPVDRKFEAFVFHLPDVLFTTDHPGRRSDTGIQH